MALAADTRFIPIHMIPIIIVINVIEEYEI
jgi:hypothetical protein